MMKQTIFRIPLRMLAFLFGIFLSVGSFAQQITVNGHVKDATGEDVIGATVRVVGTQVATVTDFDGNFSIKADKGATINVTYVGYQPMNVKVDGTTMNIILKDDAQVLENVVVIGYGVAKKNDLTGSVTAIKPDEKNHGIITTAQDMLQGKVAGVNINSSTGEPGGGAQIRIRGGASLNASNDPLIVIDGMQMAGGQKGVNNPLALVNPNDIESFTVLKDASATAIYGSRGSNGVIIITTKKGRRNQAPKISYNGNVSVSSVAKKLDVMNASEYTSFIKNYYGEGSAAWNNLGWKEYNEDGTPNVAAGTYDTDWQDEIFRNAVSHDHNVSLAGGLGNSKWSMPYRLSVGYTNQQGILRGSDYSRFTAGFTANPSLLDDHLTINANAKYSYSKTNPGGQDAVGYATRMDPTRPVRSSDEKYKNWEGFWQWTKLVTEYDPTFPYAYLDDSPMNPVERVEHYTFNKDAHVMLGNFEVDYKIHGFEDLHLHMNLAGQYSFGGEYTNELPQSTYGFYYGSTGENTEKRYNVQATAYAQYVKDFNKDNHFDIMAGYEYSRMKYWGDSWKKSYYPNTYEGTDDDGNKLAGKLQSSTDDYWRGQVVLVSWLGRANYSLLNRYLFTFTARYDGSSRFADGHRWGFFPSAAFAWRINEEPFLKDVAAISDFKLRLGWGQTGQQDTGMEYYTPTYVHGSNNHYTYPIGPNNDGTLWRPLVYNEDLTWETTTTYNVGIDFGMWNQRLTLALDLYKRKTTDLLSKPTIPAGMNFDNAMWLNAGELENTGVEFAINGKIIQTKDWFLELGVNAAYNKNKVTELYGGRDKIEAGIQVGTDQNLTYHKVGESANSFLVYQQVYDENGRPVMGCYVDRDANGIIDDNDRYFYKNIAAPWTGGFNVKVGYKNWDLGTNFRASFGNYVYNGIEAGKINTAVLYNSSKGGYYDNSVMDIVKNGWTSYNYPLTDYFIQNASFLKCDNIALGYSFDSLFKTAKYNGISGRVYASCTNVFTITNYKGIDPEQPSGLESSVYPRCRTFLFGLNLNF